MKKLSLLLGMGAVAAVFSVVTLRAQGEPEFLLTWRAESYVPAIYAGKILPAQNSNVAASLEIVEGGRLVDLSGEVIYWYLDSNFLEGGEGVQTITFPVTRLGGSSHDLRAQINSYRGQGKIMLKTVEIPVAEPEAVLEVPFPNNRFSSANIQLKGRPYFFSVPGPSDLKFSWEINGEKPSSLENPEFLDVGLAGVAPGTELTVTLNIENPLNIFEAASRSTRIIFEPQ